MALADVDSDPFSFALFAVVEESVRSELTLEKACFAEDVAGRAAAVVAPVVELGMAASVFVGLVKEAVGGGDGAFDFSRGQEWGAGFSVLLEVDRAHELFLVLDAAFGPLLRTTATDENETGEEKESQVFH